jgi:hypothetical protein
MGAFTACPCDPYRAGRACGCREPVTTACLRHAGHALTENRNGLVIDAEPTGANGRVENSVALELLARVHGNHLITLGADKAHHTRDSVDGVRACGATPHVARVLARRGGSAIDARTTRRPGYAIGQRV